MAEFPEAIAVALRLEQIVLNDQFFKASSVAQWLYKQGEEEGIKRGRMRREKLAEKRGLIAGLREGVLLIGTGKLGEPSKAQRARLESVKNAEILRAFVRRTNTAISWDELLRPAE